METSIIELEKLRWEWSQSLFLEATAESGILKCKEEIKEIEADLSIGMPNPEEYADAIMCLMDSAARAGLSATDVMEAYAKKVHINIYERTWVRNADNTYSHVKK